MKMPLFILSLIVCLALASLPPGGTQPVTLAQAHIERDYDQLPLYFVENQGQMDERVAYYIQGSDKTIYFAPDGVTFALSDERRTTNDERPPTADRRPLDETNGWRPESATRNPKSAIQNQKSEIQRWAVKLDFVGANPNVRPIAQGKTEAIISYFKGPQDQWRTGLPTYSRIVYPDLWPGIDLVYYGAVTRLKYEFVVKPGADPSRIQLAYRGATSVQINAAGQLQVTTPIGGFQDDTPVAYQDVDGRRVAVSMEYALSSTPNPLPLSQAWERGRGPGGWGEGISYGFRVGTHDPTRPLILDPAVIVYCGYIGGSGYDRGAGIAVDSAGNAYVTGDTESTQVTFPVTVGPDLTYNGGIDAFVAKVNAAGTALVYAGYIGGSGEDRGIDIAVDSAGNAYITGQTYSTETTFPVTGGPDLTYNGGTDAFVAKVNAAGTALAYAGYIGGSGNDWGHGIAVDSTGNAYITGGTGSTEATFPVTSGPDLTYNGGVYDAFVVKINAAGTALVYAGYIGGSGWDYGGLGIAVDSAGNAYVTGYTESTQATFPVTVGPDLTYNDSGDAFVAKVNAAGTALVYAGYIGGSGIDYGGGGIAVDSAGNAYVTGYTDSAEATFPVTIGPDLTYNGGIDAFVAKVNAAGTALAYAGYIGGSGSDSGYSIAMDSAGNAYITGETNSTEATFPVTVGPDLTFNGLVTTTDAFVAKVNAAGTALVYAGYIGGSDDDHGYGIAVDSAGNAYVTGYTGSTEATFPVTSGPDLTYNSGWDAFVTKVSTSGSCVSGRVADAGSTPIFGVAILAGPGLSAATNANGYYTLTGVLSGTYTLTPTLSGAIFSPVMRTVVVTLSDVIGQDFIGTIAPVAVAITGPATGFISTTYTFTATVSPVTATTPITYTWQDARGRQQAATSNSWSNTAVFSWTMTGTHVITATATNAGGTVTNTHAILISTPVTPTAPVASFTATPRSGPPPLTVQFTDASTGAITSWLWHFGDGAMSTLQNPVHTYNLTGTFDVTLTVTGPSGADSLTRVGYIVISTLPPGLTPLTDVTISGLTEGVVNTAYSFVATVSPITATTPITYTWSPAPNSGQGTSSVIFSWVTSGVKTIMVTAQNVGSTVNDTHVIAISAPPTSAGDAYEPDDTCAQAQTISTTGTIQVHTFHQPSDQDWVSFQATGGITYVVQARVPAASHADVALEVYGDCSTVVQPGQDPSFSPDVRLTFNAPTTGTYHLRLLNHDSTIYGADVEYHLSVRALNVAPDPGVLVLVAGRYFAQDDTDLQPNIRHVTNDVYSIFRAKGYPQDRIYYLATDVSIPNVNVFATKANLQYAITEWTKDKGLGPERALTLYLMDHGGADIFYLDRPRGEWVTAQELDTWLDTLQATVAPGVKINIMIEACHSGSFIDKQDSLQQTLSGAGRVIVTSTDVDAVAYPSRDGAVFSDAFLVALSQGMSLAEAFDEGEGAARLAHPDQAPWLDGNGNGIPDEAEDHQEAAQRGFAFAGSFDVEEWPPYIARSEIRAFNGSQGEIWAEVRVPPDKQIWGVWAEIYTPSYQPPPPGETMVAGPMPENLYSRGGNWYGVAYNKFNEVGAYRIVVYAQDNEGLQARPSEVIVYKGLIYLPLVLRQSP